MKLKIALVIVLTLSTHQALAGPPKTIKLKDGSTIIGEITSVANGRYVVKTNNLGDITISDEDILSIQAQGAGINAEHGASGASSLKHQVQSMQGQIMNDEAIMDSINALAEDKEIQALLQNPQLMNTIMSFDENRIQNDPVIKELLQRKDVQDIMKRIESKVAPAGK